MKIEYFPDTDTLSIVFTAGPFEAVNEDELSDVLILRDGGRIGEIVIEGASDRIDMAELAGGSASRRFARKRYALLPDRHE